MKIKPTQSSALAVLLFQTAALVWGQQQSALPVTVEVSVNSRLVPAATLEGVRPMQVGDKWVYLFHDLGKKKSPHRTNEPGDSCAM